MCAGAMTKFLVKTSVQRHFGMTADGNANLSTLHSLAGQQWREAVHDGFGHGSVKEDHALVSQISATNFADIARHAFCFQL
jgi:hypothetical protein